MTDKELEQLAIKHLRNVGASIIQWWAVNDLIFEFKKIQKDARKSAIVEAANMCKDDIRGRPVYWNNCRDIIMESANRIE